MTRQFFRYPVTALVPMVLVGCAPDEPEHRDFDGGDDDEMCTPCETPSTTPTSTPADASPEPSPTVTPIPGAAPLEGFMGWSIGCGGSGTESQYYFQIDIRGHAAEVYMITYDDFDTDEYNHDPNHEDLWQERHAFEKIYTGYYYAQPYQIWIEDDLEVVAERDQYVENQNTVFGCEDDGITRVIYATDGIELICSAYGAWEDIFAADCG